MTNFEQTKQWLMACGKTPTLENANVQIGCLLEEFCEFLNSLRAESDGVAMMLERTSKDLTWLGQQLKSKQKQVFIPTHMRQEALDALCDLEVTGNGVAYLSGFDKDSADQAVIESNNKKLIDGKPVIAPGGKIGKPKGWKAPDLSNFV